MRPEEVNLGHNWIHSHSSLLSLASNISVSYTNSSKLYLLCLFSKATFPCPSISLSIVLSISDFEVMAIFLVLLSGLQQLWDECQEVRESTPSYCLLRFCLGIQLLLKLKNSSHREMVVQRIWQRRVKRQRAKKERIKKREEQGGCLVDEPG